MLRIVSNTDVSDAPCRFRAVSRDAAMKLNVFNDYTYTLETIIQAGQKNMAVCSVQIGVHKDLRPSRLAKNTVLYISKSIATILRIFVTCKSFRIFMLIGSILSTVGFLVGLRFLYFLFTGKGQGHVQSIILAEILLGMGFQTILIGFIADLLSVNRKLLEDIQYRIKKKETDK